MGFIIDTCIWIDVERGNINPFDVNYYTKDEPVYISPITIAELNFGIETIKDQSIREKRLVALNILKKKPCLFIDNTTGEIFGSIAAYLINTGRGSDFRIQDLWIASQAIQHRMKLLTANEKDFKDIPGLDLVVFKKGDIS